MSLYRAVLTRLLAGATPEQIAADLDRPTHAIDGMIDTMRRQGQVRRIDCEGETCTSCPMSGTCSMAADSPAQYVVTPDGRALID